MSRLPQLPLALCSTALLFTMACSEAGDSLGDAATGSGGEDAAGSTLPPNGGTDSGGGGATTPDRPGGTVPAGTVEVGLGESCGGRVVGPPRVCKKGLFCESAPQTCGLAVDAPGTCAAQPDVCTKEFVPVCGCDDQTYGNDCMRRAAGVSLKHKEACDHGSGGGTTCGGIAGIACKEGMFCDVPGGTCGAADQTGMCRPRSTICADIYSPVCGCDGKTYANDCERAGAGVSKLHDGACKPAGQACGARITCGAREYCETAAGTCGKVDGGTCRPRPETCTGQYAPVCGCDGKTYPNDCGCAGAGVSMLHDGECAKSGTVWVGPGESCGGFRAAPVPVCKKGLFCESRAETCGLLADAPGICAEQPTICTKEYAPVCGCDGNTYGNDCMRRAAGASVKHKGACETKGGGGGAFCGGIAGLTCARGLVCDQEPGLCKGADIGGVCKEQAAACTRDYKPVCGCDGKTYGNDCTRLTAGVAKDHDGACAPTPTPRLLPAGSWGGQHIGIVAKNPTRGASVEFDCAAGTIVGPLEVQPDGVFKWRGSFTPGTGGPVIIDPAPAAVGATYYGRISGDTMALEIYPDGLQASKYTLTFGKTPLLFRCL